MQSNIKIVNSILFGQKLHFSNDVFQSYYDLFVILYDLTVIFVQTILEISMCYLIHVLSHTETCFFTFFNNQKLLILFNMIDIIGGKS